MNDACAGEGLARIQKEIQGEKAAALGRIGATLEALLEELRLIAAAARAAGAAAEREERAARYREVRERALRYRWYLEVQREAVGLTRHEELDACYALPAPLNPQR